MRIALVTHEYPPDTAEGGVSTYTYQMAHGLAARGHAVHVLTMSLGGDRVVQDGSVIVHRFAHRTLYPTKGRLREFLRRFEYSHLIREKLLDLAWRREIDLVEAHQIGGELLFFSLFGFEGGLPVVTRLSTTYREVAASQGWGDSADLRLSAWMEDQVLVHSRHIVSSTRVQAQSVQRRLALAPDRMSVVPYGVPIPELADPARAPNRNGQLRALFIGRLEPRKGVHVLAEAIPQVLSRLPQTTFTLVGPDTFAGAAELAIDGSGHSSFKQRLLQRVPHHYWPRVQFAGACDNRAIGQYLSACDVFVAPSLYEAPGIVYLEAMAHAKPVVGCRVGGVSEVVEDCQTGLLVPPEDPTALADALCQLLANPALRRQYGAAGRRLVEARFSLSSMVDHMIGVYERVLSQR